MSSKKKKNIGKLKGILSDDLGQNEPIPQFTYKIILMGDAGVGKTALRRRYMGEGYVTEFLNTVGADFAFRQIKSQHELISLQIWDLAGYPKFKNVRTVFYGGAFGAIVCFDPTTPSSFENLDRWINELIQYTHTHGTPLVIASTKSDLDQSIDRNSISSYIKELEHKFSDHFYEGYKIPYYETSSLNGSNVDNVFVDLIDNIKLWLQNMDSQTMRSPSEKINRFLAMEKKPLKAQSSDIDIFISYSESESILANQLYDYLVEHNLNPWISTIEGIIPKNEFDHVINLNQEIIEALDSSTILIFLMTGPSFESKRVKIELERGVSNNSTIIPIKIDEVPLPNDFELYVKPFQLIDVQNKFPWDWMSTLVKIIKEIKTDFGKNLNSGPGP